MRFDIAIVDPGYRCGRLGAVEIKKNFEREAKVSLFHMQGFICSTTRLHVINHITSLANASGVVPKVTHMKTHS